MNRRDFLTQSYLGLGGLAFSAIASPSMAEGPMAPKPQHLAAKAKRCIFLFMEGGVSQVDLFDYKPALEKYAGKQIPKPEGTVGEITTFSNAPNRVIPSPFPFAKQGQSGRWMSSLLPGMSQRVDDMAFMQGIKVDNNNHGPAVYHTLTGNMFPGSASVGAWATYGLGSENQNLPGFIDRKSVV